MDRCGCRSGKDLKNEGCREPSFRFVYSQGIEISWFFYMRDDGGARTCLGSCLASASLTGITAGSRVQGPIHV